MSPLDGSVGKGGISDRVLAYVLSHPKEELTDKQIALDVGEPYRNVRQATRRLEQKNLIRKVKRGHNVYYTADQLSTEEETEKEHLLNKLIAPHDFIQNEPCLHNVSFTLSVKELKGMKPEIFAPESQCIKTIGGVSEASPTWSITDILNPLSAASITQRWNVPMWMNPLTIKGGTQEAHRYADGITIKFQVFGTGSFQVFIEATDRAMSIPRFFHVCDYISAVMKSRCGYGLEELKDYLGVRFEFNRDEKMGTVAVEGSGKYCITLRQANALFVRTYSKIRNVEYADEGAVKEEWLRSEVGTREEPVQYSEFMRQAEAMMMGGVNAQWMVRNQYEQERVNKGVMEHLLRQGNALEYLLREVKTLKEKKTRRKKHD